VGRAGRAGRVRCRPRGLMTRGLPTLRRRWLEPVFGLGRPTAACCALCRTATAATTPHQHHHRRRTPRQLTTGHAIRTDPVTQYHVSIGRSRPGRLATAEFSDGRTAPASLVVLLAGLGHVPPEPLRAAVPISPHHLDARVVARTSRSSHPHDCAHATPEPSRRRTSRFAIRPRTGTRRRMPRTHVSSCRRAVRVARPNNRKAHAQATVHQSLPARRQRA
jgi:hypothetical protein